MKKGEVWIVEVPGIDGHEQRGLRPAIFIADTKTTMAIIIPCTANRQALHFPFTTEIEPSQNNGLDTVSVALVFQLRAIDKRRLVNKIGKIDAKILKNMDSIIKRLLSL